MRAKLPWILLAVSIVLNIFVIGGFVYTKRVAESRMMDRSPIMAAARELNLSGPQKEAFEKMRADIRKSSSDIRNEARPLRRELLGELAKPQPDFAAVDRKIDDLGDVQGKKYKAMVRSVHEFQQSLTPEQQEAFRKGIRENSLRRGMQGGRRGDGRDGSGREKSSPPPR